MTFRQLKDLVAYWLDDLQFGYFSETQVAVWLNNAQTELQKKLLQAGQNYYTKCVQTTLVVNQRDYSLPQDFKKLHRLEVVVSGTSPNESLTMLVPITLNQQDLVIQGASTPAAYTILRNKLTVRPAPDTALTMRMTYSYQVEDMALDTDIPDAPEAYHEMIALMAAQDGFIKDGRASELLVKKLSEYQKQLDQDAQERNVDMPRSIVETGDDSTAGFYW